MRNTAETERKSEERKIGIGIGLGYQRGGSGVVYIEAEVNDNSTLMILIISLEIMSHFFSVLFQIWYGIFFYFWSSENSFSSFISHEPIKSLSK